ncbi:hypothetical protein NECAME_06123 [Necator americanus]|uniref:Uncharacterized protein n=1 Tax=Necator americanus TaxID=51031 RepID=W2TVV4_NECAM|nr:hypothetical protein NECAME_06123 [Necator americanus]ETN85958.1 hypothetical protein NECAME_06123 [Necator americanus]
MREIRNNVQAPHTHYWRGPGIGGGGLGLLGLYGLSMMSPYQNYGYSPCNAQLFSSSNGIPMFACDCPPYGISYQQYGCRMPI